MTKNSPIKKALLASGMLLVSSSGAMAQEFHNTTERIGGIWASGMPTVTIAAGADITVDGDWYLTANTITIDPAAKISGSGTIHLMTPQTYGNGNSATTLNAGGNMGSGTGIGCMVSVENNNTVVLAGANDLVMNNGLNFSRSNAHLVLGGRNLVFTSAPVALSQLGTPSAGFSNQTAAATSLQDAYIVTNGAGVVTKQGLANNTSFTYTVGRETPGNNGSVTDYTPVTVTNTAAARNISTQVKTYATSAALENTAANVGIDRTWQITGSAAGTATVALTNNAATEQTLYTRNTAFVTQQVGNGVWDNTTGAAPTTPNYTHTRTALTIPTSGITSYFSKSNAPTSVSANAGLAVYVGLQGDMQGSGIMRNDLQTYFGTTGLLPTTDPYGLGATYAAINNPAAQFPTGTVATIADWVRVEVWNPAVVSGTPIQSKAGLLLTDGRVVDVDGSILAFNSQAYTARAVVKQRNHMAVMSNDLTANGASIFRGNYPYNFTTSLSQASVQPGEPAQMTLVGGKWCMWAGDVNQDLVVEIADRNIVNSRNLAGDYDAYQREDVNLDGVVDIADVNITNSVNLQGIYSTLFNY